SQLRRGARCSESTKSMTADAARFGCKSVIFPRRPAPGLRPGFKSTGWRKANARQKMVVLRKRHAGLHLTINPVKPLPPEVHVVRQYLDQGIVLNDQERASILRGRDEGVGTAKTILDQTIPGFAPDTRLKFANQIVDALFDKN